MMLFAKFLFPFVRFSWSLSLIEFYPCLILFNQYQARYLDWPPESPDNQYHLNK